MKASALWDRDLLTLKGMGERWVSVLRKDMGIGTYAHLLMHYPFRYEDRTVLHNFSFLPKGGHYVQLSGILRRLQMRKGGILGWFSHKDDENVGISLRWFQNASWVRRQYMLGRHYVFVWSIEQG